MSRYSSSFGSSSYVNSAGPLWVYLLIFAAFGLLGMCKSPIAGGDFPIGYPHTITGEVSAEPSTRYVRNDSGGQEKVSLTIKVDKVPAIMSSAFYDGEVIVECLSTRCTQIKMGETHQIRCRMSGRFFEENVALCKHDRKVKGAPEPDKED